MSIIKDVRPSKEAVSSVEKHSEDATALLVRRELAWAVTGLLVTVSIIAAFQKGALPVLDKVLPLAAIIFGFFFGNKTSK